MKKNKKSLLLVVLIGLLLVTLLQWLSRKVVIFPIKVTDNSMSPSIEKGSRLFILYKQLTTIQKNDMVYTSLPFGGYKVCRVAAQEGDQISILQRQIFVNDKLISRQNKSVKSDNYIPAELSNKDNLSKLTLRPGYFFCINDNLNIYTDSRMYGAFKNTSIIGKVYYKNYIFNKPE